MIVLVWFLCTLSIVSVRLTAAEAFRFSLLHRSAQNWRLKPEDYR